MNLTNMISLFRSVTNYEVNFISDSQVTDLVNQGLREFASKTESLESTNTQDITANTASYTLPTDFQKILAVYYSGATANIPLYELSQQDLDRMLFNWKGQAGTPRWFFVDTGLTQIRLYPTPNTSYTNGLLVEYTQAANNLVNGADAPNMPPDYHAYGAYYAGWGAALRDENQILAAAMDRKMKEIEAEAWRKYNHPSKTIMNKKRPHIIKGPRVPIFITDQYPLSM